MMNYYVLAVGDPSSDNGFAEVLVLAKDARQAHTKLRHHLQACKRKDLIQKTATCTRVYKDSNGVVHSTVDLGPSSPVQTV